MGVEKCSIHLVQLGIVQEGAALYARDLLIDHDVDIGKRAVTFRVARLACDCQRIDVVAAWV